MQPRELIKSYYDSYNAGDIKTFLSLLDDNVIHDINQGDVEIGKSKFEVFMNKSFKAASEKVSNLIIMSSDDEKHIATKFTVEGIYKQTCEGCPPANGQHYKLDCGSFFEISAGKIKRVTVYYNMSDWIRQVSE